MNFDIKRILEGVNNAVFVKEEVEKVANERIEICKLCHHFSPNAKARGMEITRPDAHCLDCKCNMYLKTRALSAMCPLGTKESHFPYEKSKWGPVAPDDVSVQLENTPELKKEMDKYKINLAQHKIEE